MSTEAVKQAIIRAAREAGNDPAFALAVAERESAFNPNAHSSKTIHGLYQMRGDLRAKYGVGDSNDPYTQAVGWNKFIGDVKGDMSSRLGRPVTDAEAYLGHHFGDARAARTLKMDPNTPTDAVFTPNEMSLNPHFGKAGTIGNLNSTVTADIDNRIKKFGGTAQNADTPNSGGDDLSDLGETADAAPSPGVATGNVATATPAPADLSSFGETDDAQQASAVPATADLSSFGDAA